MASAPHDPRRAALSPKPKGRENAKDTLCRNVTIYGHCRFEDKGTFVIKPNLMVLSTRYYQKSWNLASTTEVEDRPGRSRAARAQYVILADNSYDSCVRNLSTQAVRKRRINGGAIIHSCAFNHDPTKGRGGGSTSSGKRLNVDSPAFTPNSQQATLAAADPNRGGTGLSPKAANAAPFKPKGLGSGIEFNPSSNSRKTYNPAAAEWGLNDGGVQGATEFLPSALHQLSLGDASSGLNAGLYDAFGNTAGILAHQAGQQAQINPYAQDGSGAGNPFFQANAYSAPTNYHLYAPMGPYKEPTHAYQRTAADFFIPDAVREELQRKNAETLQTLPNSTLPLQIDHFHSLVPLDKTNQRNASHFGYPSWIYKTVSAKDGQYYALRRLEGFKLSSERPIRTINAWKRIRNANFVSVVDAFTSRAFNGESSLMIVTEYHPLAKTLQETHITNGPRVQSRQGQQYVPEQTMWMYLVQIANALRSIHGAGLAARLIDLTKVLVTSKGRIRLNGSGILDIVQFDLTRPLQEVQKDDFRQFGRLLVALGTGRASIQSGLASSMEPFNRAFSQTLRDRVYWLLNQGPDKMEGIEKFMAGLEVHLMSAMDNALSAEDHAVSILNTALEDGRIARLQFKLNSILERPLANGQYADGGERGVLRLFRDYVFHQVDHGGSPVIDLAHMISCLNKLDSGTEEKIMLTSRDEQIVYIVSYKEMKTEISRAFDALRRAAAAGLYKYEQARGSNPGVSQVNGLSVVIPHGIQG